jgi:4'-phosphopantetheinyl transferase EntD
MTTLVADLFRAEALTAEAVPTSADDELYPEERAYIRTAVTKRRAEFATTRILARRLLGEIGIPPGPLVPHKDRAPIWPGGIAGSISHTSDYCAVVVDRAPDVLSVGLDVETLRVVDASLFDSIITPRERAWLRKQPLASHNDLGLLFFSAKEAYYKCQYPVTCGFLEFSDVELDLDLERRRFEARVLKPRWPASVARLQGKFAFRDRKVLCGVTFALDPPVGAGSSAVRRVA